MNAILMTCYTFSLSSTSYSGLKAWYWDLHHDKMVVEGVGLNQCCSSLVVVSLKGYIVVIVQDTVDDDDD